MPSLPCWPAPPLLLQWEPHNRLDKIRLPAPLARRGRPVRRGLLPDTRRHWWAGVMFFFIQRSVCFCKAVYIPNHQALRVNWLNWICCLFLPTSNRSCCFYKVDCWQWIILQHKKTGSSPGMHKMWIACLFIPWDCYFRQTVSNKSSHKMWKCPKI